jgi:Zn-dependent protease
MWDAIKGFAKKHPNLTSLVTFALFFLAIAYILKGQLSPANAFILAFIVSVSLAIHEYSHVIAMKRFGMDIRGVIFIPFLGAVALGGGKQIARHEECFMALAGPLAGYLSAVPVYFLYKVTEQPVYYLALFLILMINLFNMLPLSPMDGGRVIKSLFMSFKNRKAGFVLWVIIGLWVIWQLAKIGVNIVLSAFIAFIAWQEILHEWKFYKIRERIKSWITENYGAAASHEVIFNSLREEIFDEDSVYAESRAGEMIRAVCKSNIDVNVMLNIVKEGLYPPHLAPLSMRHRALFIFLYVVFIACPFIFLAAIR